MNFLYFLHLEIKRCFLSPVTRVVSLLTVCAPLAGYWFYKPVGIVGQSITRAGTYIANPVLAGSIGGVILFALLTLYELSRVRENKIDAITDSIVSPFTLNTAKIISLLTAATVTGILTTLVYLPYTIYKTAYLFDAGTYFGSFLIIFTPVLWIACLMAAAFYQITRRTDLSFIMLAAVAAPCFGAFMKYEFILKWINPTIDFFTDIFSNSRVLRIAAYNRLFWIIGLSGLLLLSFLCMRRYGKGIIGSLIVNLKKIWLAPLSATLISAAVCLYLFQPFVNHAPMEYKFHEEGNENITVTSTHTQARPNMLTGFMHGKTTINIVKAAAGAKKCLLEIDCGYTVHYITANGNKIDFKDLKNDLYVSKQVSFKLPEDEKVELIIDYSGYPQMHSASAYRFFGNEINGRYIQLCLTSFTPRLSAKHSKKRIISADIILPARITPTVMCGNSHLIKDNYDGTKTWRLSSDYIPFINLYAYDRTISSINTANMSMDFYYAHKSKPVMEKYNVNGTFKEAIEFCEKHYGVLSNLDNNKLVLLQTAGSGGGAPFKGVCTYGELAFAEDGLKDTNKGASGIEVMAHELIHQWWGLSVAIEENPSGPYPEWSAEGPTVFATYRMMKGKFGPEYAKRHYTDKWERAIQDRNRNFYHRNPQYMERLPERFSSKIKETNTSVNQYSLMPLKILKAAELLGGEEKMDQVMAKIYKTKTESDDPYLSYEEFLSACGLSKEDLKID